VDYINAKQRYNVGDTFDSRNLAVTAFYDNGTTRDVTGDAYISWTDGGGVTWHLLHGDPDTAAIHASQGWQRIDVSWGGKTTHYVVFITDQDTALADPVLAGGSKPPCAYPLPQVSGITFNTAVYSPGESIWYTTDGSSPYPDGPGAVKYTGSAIDLMLNATGPTYLKAAVFKDDDSNTSDEATFTYYALTAVQPAGRYLFPTIINLSAGDPGLKIYYTIGSSPSDPTTGSNLYYGGIVGGPNTVTIKARAYNGTDPSIYGDVLTVTYTKLDKVLDTDLPRLADILRSYYDPYNTADNPLDLEAAISLGTANWTTFIAALNTGGKYLNLDMTDCTAVSGGALSGTTFNPMGGGSAGKDRIVSLTLPDAATAIYGVSTSSVPFGGFSSLKSIVGNEILTVGGYAFYWLGAVTVRLPKATTLGTWAFGDCSVLKDLYIPSVTTMGNGVFYNYVGSPLVITMGATPPSSVGTGSFTVDFDRVRATSAGPVTLKVPTGKKADYEAWEGVLHNGNSKLVVVIEEY
jgi:hypothetical protein